MNYTEFDKKNGSDALKSLIASTQIINCIEAT